MTKTVSKPSATSIATHASHKLDLETLVSIERQVQSFREAKPWQPVKFDFQPYVKCLPRELHETATLELVFEVLQQQHQDRTALIAACKDQFDSELLNALFGTGTSAENLAGDKEWPRIDGYDLVEIIGTGGTAIVFRAIQHNPNRSVALKVPKGYEDGFDRLTLSRFYSEARLQAKYLGAGVPAVFEFGLTDGGAPFISMELVEGKSFETCFRSEGQPFVFQREGVRTIAKICRAIGTIHADGNSHLDLSPANVFIMPDGQVKILDFGFGQDSSQGRKRPEAAGTPCYMAPEKARGDVSKFSARTDVFSLGAFLARMLTSEHLLPSTMSNADKLDRIAAGDFADAEDRVRQSHKEHGVPKELINLTLECLSTEPISRPRNASEVADRIEAFFRSEENELQRLKVEGAARRARSQIMLPAFATILAVLVTGALVSFRYAVVANAERSVANTEKTRAARNAELRFAALEDVILLVADDSLRRAGQTQLQRNLLERVRPRIEDVLAFEDDDEATKQQQGLAWNSLSVIRQAMHEAPEAFAAANKAEAVLRELCLKPNATTATKFGLAASLGNQVMMLGQSGRFDVAIEKAKESSTRFNELMADTASDKNANLYYRASLTECNWANCLLRSGQTSDSLSHYLQAVTHIEVATKILPNEVVYRAWNAKLLSNLADLYRNLKDVEKAAAYGEESIGVAKRLNDDFPADIDGRECLAVCLTNAGLQKLESEDPVTSLPLFEEALKHYSALSQQVPAYGEFTWGQAMSHSNVGAALSAGPAAGWIEAKKHLEDAEVTYKKLEESMPDSAELKLYIDENNGRLQQLKDKLAANTNAESQSSQ